MGWTVTHHSAELCEAPDRVVILVEQARQNGPPTFIARQLLDLAEVAKASGVTRDELAAALLTQAIHLCRPDAASRASLATHLIRQARFLDPEAVIEAAPW